MRFFRPERALSHLLRHDPFSPFLSRSAVHSPLSRFFELHHPRAQQQLTSPFCAPFFTVFEEARNHDQNHYAAQQQQQKSAAQQQQSQQEQQSGQQQPQSTSASTTNQQQQDVSRTDRSQDWLDRRSRRHRGHRQQQHHPLSLFSPFASPFPSLFSNAPFAPLNAFAPLASAMPAMPEMTLDMFSTPQAYTVHAAVPGLEKKDIKITVEDGVLTIEAERRETSQRGQPTSNAASSTPASAPSTTASSSNGADPATASPSSASTSQPAAEVKAADGQAAATTGADATTTSAAAPATPQSTSTPAAATTSSGAAVQGNEGEDGEVDVHHVETYYGLVSRSVQLPEDAKADELTARYENGVIKIDIPRQQQEAKKQGRRIEIQ